MQDLNYTKLLIALGIFVCALVFIFNVFSKDKFVLTNSSIDSYDYNVIDDNYIHTLEKLHNSIDENIYLWKIYC